MTEGTSCQWNIECNEPHNGVFIGFNEITTEGVRAFETAMTPLDAISFGLDVIWRARHLLTGEDHDEICICDDQEDQ